MLPPELWFHILSFLRLTELRFALPALGHVQALLDQNADPNIATTTDGTTPLFMAAQNGHVDAVQALLEHNADPNLARATDTSTHPPSIF